MPKSGQTGYSDHNRGMNSTRANQDDQYKGDRRTDLRNQLDDSGRAYQDRESGANRMDSYYRNDDRQDNSHFGELKRLSSFLIRLLGEARKKHFKVRKNFELPAQSNDTQQPKRRIETTSIGESPLRSFTKFQSNTYIGPVSFNDENTQMNANSPMPVDVCNSPTSMSEIIQSCLEHTPAEAEDTEFDFTGLLYATPLLSDVEEFDPLKTLATLAADQIKMPVRSTCSDSFSIQCQTPKWSGQSKETQTATKLADQGTQTDWDNDVPLTTKLVIPDIVKCETSFFSELSENSIRHEEYDSNDVTWTPEESDSDSGDESDICDEESEYSYQGEKKYIVYESQLDKLMEKCDTCSGNVEIEKKVNGAQLICTLHCENCQLSSKWSSQPTSGTLAMGHLELSAAIMFSGSSPYKFLRALQFAGIQTFKPGVYFKLQKVYISPAIGNVWESDQARRVCELEEDGREIRLGGDARCCSPGHTAKFGSYSMMDLVSGQILDVQLVQSNEVKNSYAMELEGLKRSLAFLTEDNNVRVTHLVTDRHSAVKKYMREHQQNIVHWFDVWHVAKGVYKKLEAAGKKKGCEKVHAWARSVSNHLYWCAASSKGDGELLQQKWLSILNHVTNVHEGHGDRFERCEHGDIGERMWMKPGFKPHAELTKVVKGKLLIKDVKKLSPAEQTSSLEAFHKVICSFVPKSTHYKHAHMEARLFLAALHFNENCNRKQGVTKDGRLQYSVSYPKARKGEPVAHEVKTEQTFGYVNDLMNEVLALREFRPSYSTAKQLLINMDKARPLPLSQSTPRRLSKQDVIDAHVSRFNR